MFKLREYQEEAVAALFEYYKHPRALENGKPVKRNPLICLPTGTGKSLVIGEFLRRAFEIVPNTRAVMATHVKTLIDQNAEKLQEIWPVAPLGIFSAGLKQRDIIQPIIFGGIQSMAGKFPIFGHRDFLVIDEAHLVGSDGEYLKFINELLLKNPYLKVIGLSATPYRMGLGSLTNGPIFTDVVYDLCNIPGFARLIAEGYLSPLIPKRAQTQLDVSKVNISSRGDYVEKELQAAVDRNDVTYNALTEFVEHGYNRRSWLVFASGIEHADHIAEMLNSLFGISTVALHSKKKETVNDAALKAWRSGEVRCAVSMGKLTTGIDHPPLDYIGMLRPTMSTGLWVQMLGRGTRPFEGKENCLVMDFAGNTRRLGPINDPVIPRLRSKGPPGDAPVRICPNCQTYNHARATECIACGEAFSTDPNINRTAGTDELLRSDLPQVEMFPVNRMVLSEHKSKKSGGESIKVCYYCELRTFYEWINFESSIPYVQHKAHDWFRQRFPFDQHPNVPRDKVPETNAEVISIMSMLRPPAQIRVWINREHPKVMGCEF